MPRVKPRPPTDEERLRRAEARNLIRIEDRSPYGPRSPHSWFRDRLAVDRVERQRTEAIAAGVRIDHIDDVPELPHPVHGTTEEARQRLGAVETRDVTTSDPGAGAWLPAGSVPNFVAQRFQVAARAKAALTNLIPREAMPPGMVIDLPHWTTGASVAVQVNQADAPAEANVDATDESAPVATCTGMVDVSQQAFDRSIGGSLDLYLAAELGAALAERVEAQVIAGTGTSGETSGLIGRAGTSVSYTAATPTGLALVKALWNLFSSTATAYGAPPSTLVGHPRRISWVEKEAVGATAPFNPIRLPGNQSVQAAAVPTTRGAGTNEDVLLFVEPAELVLVETPPRIDVFGETLAGTLKVKVRALQFIALLVREPKSIGLLSGTGLASPSWT
jgi:hypothetical protein